jgi:outer membrane lipoprotein-sorting protein
MARRSSSQVDRKLNPESYEMYRKLINIEPDGRKKEFVLFSVKKGRDKMVALFLDPPSEKGRATLRLGDNMWLYIPNVGKPIRITSLQSVVGGVFNNSDILNLDYSVEYNVEKAAEEGKSYLLELKAKSGASPTTG